MLLKIIFVFLVLMAGVALIGRVLFPSALPKLLRKRDPNALARACPKCGRPRIGRGPCDCGGAAR